MKIEDLSRANQITGTLKRLNEAIRGVESIRTDISFKVIDGNSNGAYIDSALLDPLAKEMCKTAILSNLQGKVKQLEAEFESL